jgi:hypothetical protein
MEFYPKYLRYVIVYLRNVKYFLNKSRLINGKVNLKIGEISPRSPWNMGKIITDYF